MAERKFTQVKLELPKDLAEELENAEEEIKRSIRLGIIIDRTPEFPVGEPQSLDEIRHRLFQQSIQEAVYRAPVLQDISAIERRINLESDFLIESDDHEVSQYKSWRLRLGPTLIAELNKISIKRHTTIESLLAEFVRHYIEIKNAIPEDF